MLNQIKSNRHLVYGYRNAYYRSLYLFALYTGSRCVTCVNVKLSNIKLLENINGKLTITIN